MGIGVFVAIVSVFTVVRWTLLAPELLFRAFLVLGFAGNLLPYMRSGLWLGMERLEWFLFNLLALGPLLMCLLLWLNFLVHGPVERTEHVVAHTEKGRTQLIYTFQDGHLDAYPRARSVYWDPGDPIGTKIIFSEAVGLVGVPVILRKEIK